MKHVLWKQLVAALEDLPLWVNLHAPAVASLDLVFRQNPQSRFAGVVQLARVVAVAYDEGGEGGADRRGMDPIAISRG